MSGKRGPSRLITIVSESKREEEEALFSHLIEIFKEISKKYSKNFA